MKAHPRRPANQAPAPRSNAIVSLLPASSSVTSVQAVEVIEAELVDKAGSFWSDISPDIASAVLDSFLDERGRLVPAKSVPVGALPSEDAAARVKRAQALDVLRANAWADDTLRSYGHGVRAWREWCLQEGVAVLPLTPQLVADHLLDYGFLWDGDQVVLDENGNPEARVSMGAIEMRLASLNKAAEFIGLPRPGANEGLRELMRGMRRTLLTAPKNQKNAIDHDLLLRCLAATTGRTFVAARGRAAVLLRARRRLTAGQLAKLQWADVTISADEVILDLPPTGRYAVPVRLTVRAHPSNPQLCIVAALKDLRALSRGLDVRMDLVFSHSDGEAMTRQALHTMVDKVLKGSGGWEADEIADRELGAVLARECPVTPCETARDRALLLTGFWGALRRSNLSALNWRDLIEHGDDGIEVVMRKSKTDQEGRGDSVFMPHGEPTAGIPAPADALRFWRQEVTNALGRTPRGNEPVFMALTPSGKLKIDGDGHPKRLKGDAINEIVQRLTVASGITSRVKAGERHPYGAHSLRAGFVTESVEQGLSIPDIQSVTKHKNVDVLIGYVRKIDAKKHNASRKLFGKIG
jgi:integrase